MLRRTFYEMILVILVAIVLALAAYFFRPEAFSRPSATEQQPSSSSSKQLFTPITIETAKSLFEKGQVLFADSRSKRAFEEGHIQGAIHLDPDEFDKWSNSLVDRTKPDQIFVTYCEGPKCPLARQLAEKLALLGFEKVFYLEDGWTQWQANRMPTGTEKSK